MWQNDANWEYGTVPVYPNTAVVNDIVTVREDAKGAPKAVEVSGEIVIEGTTAAVSGLYITPSCSLGFYWNGNECLASGTTKECHTGYYDDKVLEACVADPVANDHDCKSGSDCYRGPTGDAWNEESRWSNNRLPQYPDKAIVTRSVKVLQEVRAAPKAVEVIGEMDVMHTLYIASTGN